MTEPKDLDHDRFNEADVDLMVALLGNGAWWRAAEVCDWVSHHDMSWDTRYVRKLAHASGGRVLSYPGSPGYKLTAKATDNEVKAGCSVLLSQSVAMRERRDEIVLVRSRLEEGVLL